MLLLLPRLRLTTTAVAAWVAERNAKGLKVNWRFTTKDARIKLKPLNYLILNVSYPQSIAPCDKPNVSVHWLS